MSALRELVETTRAAIERRAERVSSEELRCEAAARLRHDPVRPFRQALSGPGLTLIAEHKRRSPSAGLIREGLELEQVVSAYERGGAGALSVLTEESRFGGSLEDLRAARAASSLPILRKDFMIDSFQLHESLAAGADAVLLIVAALPAAELEALHAEARALGLDALVEVHDRSELEVAAACGATLIGINNRDLATLEVDVRRTFELLPHVPGGATVVAESGFSRREQLEELAAHGVGAVLIGEALMRAADVETACRELAGGPR
jgi:indole-3-glycerol phosphate synthase